MKIFFVIMAVAWLAVAFMFVKVQFASAHLEYDNECCHDQDCRPATEEEQPKFKVEKLGVRDPTGQLHFWHDVKQSPDGEAHWCPVQWGAYSFTRCVYWPKATGW